MLYYSLIPKELDNRYRLAGEFFRVEVNIAAKILQNYKFEYNSRKFSGGDCPGEVALSEHDGRLQVFMTRNNISATMPPPELGNKLCDRLGITNAVHRSLIYFTLVENDQERLFDAFAREGIYVPESDLKGKQPLLISLWD